MNMGARSQRRGGAEELGSASTERSQMSDRRRESHTEEGKQRLEGRDRRGTEKQNAPTLFP